MQLPLWLYLLVSAAAIAAMAYWIHRLKPSAPSAIAPEDALRLFREDYPRVESSSASVTPDGHTVLILAPSGAVVGCVTRIGLRWTVRRIGARDVAKATADGTRTKISFADFAWPSLTVDWRDPTTAREWRDRFDAMRRADHA
jgi:hypothetical protein